MHFILVQPVGFKWPIRLNLDQVVSIEPHIPNSDEDDDEYTVTLTFSNNSVYILSMSDVEFYTNYIPH